MLSRILEDVERERYRHNSARATGVDKYKGKSEGYRQVQREGDKYKVKGNTDFVTHFCDKT